MMRGRQSRGMGWRALGVAAVLICTVADIALADGAYDGASRNDKTDVLCVAGCRAKPPRIVQRHKHFLPANPVVREDKPKVIHFAPKLWCYEKGGCRGVAGRRLSRGRSRPYFVLGIMY